MQDLSVYSWLDCEPDDLYKLTRYSLSELQDVLPHPVPDYLNYWRQHGPGMQHISPWLSSLGSFSFAARPMQVVQYADAHEAVASKHIIALAL